MLALPCDYASVDVLDLLGTNKVNMTKNIVKVRYALRYRSKFYVDSVLKSTGAAVFCHLIYFFYDRIL